jgi:acyl carrier protein
MDQHLNGSRGTMARIRKVLVESLQLDVSDEEVSYEQMLEEISILDSIAILEFVAAVEKEFGIRMEPGNLDFDFLRDLSVLAAYIEQRIEARSATETEGAGGD